MAYIRMINASEAEGELKEVYTAMANRPIPSAYRAPHGDQPAIIRSHSLDATLMRVTFSTSGTNHQGELTWAERELISAAASRTNQCLY